MDPGLFFFSCPCAEVKVQVATLEDTELFLYSNLTFPNLNANPIPLFLAGFNIL